MRIFRQAVCGVIACVAGAILPLVVYGKSYNRVDYNIAARLDADKRSISGRAAVLFHNGTALPLKELVFHLYPNAYRPGTNFIKTMMYDGQEEGELFYYPGKGAYGGLDIKRVAVGRHECEARVDETLMRVSLPEPVPPGAAVEVTIDFVTKIPQVKERLNMRRDIYSAALWYPKVAVYDDDGWDDWQFDYIGEFYGDFGDYKVSLTLPEGFVCGSTGILQETVHNSDATKTEVYKADNVHDFAWVASQKYVKTETEWNGVKISVLLPKMYKKESANAHNIAQKALAYYSKQFGPYPYPGLTIGYFYFGAGAAMEYPGMIMEDISSELDASFFNGSYILLGHEIAHQWWYGAVGNNEHKEAFMDEAFAEYALINFVKDCSPDEASYFKYPKSLSFLYWFKRQDLRYMDLSFYREIFRTRRDLPLSISSGEYPPGFMGLPYSKGPAILSALEDIVGGKEKMFALLRAYFTKYQFKNVSLKEFRQFVDDYTGRDMSWFFDDWIYGTVRSDLSVSSVLSAPADKGFKNSVTITQKGTAQPLPAQVAVTLRDGSNHLMRSSGAAITETLVWESSSPVRKVIVDPEEKLPEMYRFNNKNTIDFYTHINFPGVSYQYRFDRPLRSAAARLLQGDAADPLTEYLPSDKYSLVITPLVNTASDGFNQYGLSSVLYKKDYFFVTSTELYNWRSEQWSHELGLTVPLPELTRSYNSNITVSAGKDERYDSRFIGAGMTLYLSPHLYRNPSHTLKILPMLETFEAEETRSVSLAYSWKTNLTDYKLNGHSFDLFIKRADSEGGLSWGKYRIGLEKYCKLFWLASLRLKAQYGDSSEKTHPADLFRLSYDTPMERFDDGGSRFNYLGAEIASPLIYDLNIRRLHGRLTGNIFYNQAKIEAPASSSRADAGTGLSLDFFNKGYGFNLAARYYFLTENHGNPQPADRWVVECAYQIKL